MIKLFISSKKFQNFIATLIVINGIILGLATSKQIVQEYSSILTFLDNTIIAIFTIEIILRIYVHRLSFFKDPWSLFDFFVVAISLVPANEGLSILRVLRVLRLFRLLTVIPQMRTIIAALLGVIPGIASVSMVLLLFFYVFAIMATNLYGASFPQWFGTLGESMYTLFQVMTLESWSMGIARPIMELYPYAWVFFVIYILIVTFVMVNLFIGLIVDAIFTIKGEQKEEKSKELQEIELLKEQVQELKQILLKKSENDNT
ncbi:ion transporter [Malaciobacter marinus]|uniref:Ion transporter n=1 Tax=Malaciobacter marinus TaxID=505249 RepID=A0A347TM41_9BACT|nr:MULTISPECIES: ion transporter [Malaciobacter]AXX87669.1 ion transporter [Malaciobacter marinus]PHO11651.1 ion transporter [Malaciobacter marinus]PHO15136.1 ion transporter [Malaciobacter marinus]RYA24921.1 ion transporter [Malaciobacter halophilus]